MNCCALCEADFVIHTRIAHFAVSVAIKTNSIDNYGSSHSMSYLPGRGTLKILVTDHVAGNFNLYHPIAKLMTDEPYLPPISKPNYLFYPPIDKL